MVELEKQTLEIVVVDAVLLEQVLPLIEQYQRFYRVDDIDTARNKIFFSQFTRDHNRGILHALTINGVVVGFSTLYFCFSSAQARGTAVLNDLFVVGHCRGKGYGRKLIGHAQAYARALGYGRLQWLTARDNKNAQYCYDALPVKKSEWLVYVLDT